MKPLLTYGSLLACLIFVLNGCSAGADPAPEYKFTDVFAAAASGHVYRSTDKGITWADASNGLPITGAIKCLALRGSNILAGTDTGVYETSDNGAHWRSISAGYYGSVYALISDGNFIYECNADGLYRSTDDGKYWEVLQSGTSFSSIARFGSHFYATIFNDHGLLRSPDQGVNWEYYKLDSVFHATPRSLSATNTYLYAGTSGQGVYRSSDEGKSWHSLYTVDAGAVGKISASGSHLIMSDLGLIVLTSSNNGDSWTKIGSLNRSGNGSNLALLLDHEFAFASNSDAGLFRSTDYGTTWNLVQLSATDTSTITAVVTK